MTETAKEKILVVEDDDDVRGALAILLESQGYRVFEAHNGKEALEQLDHTADIGMILLDLYMPEMTGWAFRSEQIKDSRLAEIPVVVMSADHAAARNAITPGVVAVMGKPIEFDRLLKIVQQHAKSGRG